MQFKIILISVGDMFILLVSGIFGVLDFMGWSFQDNCATLKVSCSHIEVPLPMYVVLYKIHKITSYLHTPSESVYQI